MAISPENARYMLRGRFLYANTVVTNKIESGGCELVLRVWPLTLQ